MPLVPGGTNVCSKCPEFFLTFGVSLCLCLVQKQKIESGKKKEDLDYYNKFLLLTSEASIIFTD